MAARGPCKHKKGVCKRFNSGLCSACCMCLKRMGRSRKNEDEQSPQRVMAKRHTKTPARFLNTLSDSDMSFLIPFLHLEVINYRQLLDHQIKLD